MTRIITRTRPFTNDVDVEQGDEIQQLDWDTSIMPFLPLLSPFLAQSVPPHQKLVCLQQFVISGRLLARIHRDNKTLWEEGKINRTLQRKELETVVERRGNGNGKKSMNARAAGRHPSIHLSSHCSCGSSLVGHLFNSALFTPLHPLLSANTVITGYKNILEFRSSHLLMITWPKLQTTSCKSA